jgi:hypothetical protein
VALAPLTMMIFVIGFFPNVLLARIKDAAGRVESDVEARVMMNPAPQFYEGPIRLMSPRPEQPRAVPASPQTALAGETH